MNNRWGTVIEISRVDWISEVTESSKTCWVIVHLYNDSVAHCDLVNESILSLAPRFPALKFVKIRSTQAVENWPDKNLPTLFIYNQGELKHQLLTLNSLRGDSFTTQDLEWWLSTKNILETELEGPPEQAKSKFNVSSKALASSIYDDDEDEI